MAHGLSSTVLIVVLGAGSGSAAEPAPAGRLVPAAVLDSRVLDPNDGKHSIYAREGGALVARPGVYPYAYGPTLLFDPRDNAYKMWAGVGWNGDTISYKQAPTLAGLREQPWEITLEPRRTEPVADQDHCCDPSVIVAGCSNDLVYDSRQKNLVMVGNESLPGRGVQVRFVTFSADFKQLDDCHILTTDLPTMILGEGLGVLTDLQRRWLYPPQGPGTVTIAGATYQKRADMPVEHIAGPTCGITWRFEPATNPP